ncbi:hypothetical protein [Nocardia sp. NBC_00403]|uniref:hypothetical protein n=1 Tax=Nocardia sp. NBC_00403 TaxID=2975990 RepID=UPI002E1A0A24
MNGGGITMDADSAIWTSDIAEDQPIVQCVREGGEVLDHSAGGSSSAMPVAGDLGVGGVEGVGCRRRGSGFGQWNQFEMFGGHRFLAGTGNQMHATAVCDQPLAAHAA